MTEMTAPQQGVPSELNQGTVLSGRFEVGAKYDSDGFARLYGAKDSKTGREISLRQVRSGLLTADGIKFLRRQVKTASAVKHPNVHNVFGLTSSPDGSPVLVQDRVSGRNLADYVRRNAAKGSPVTVRGAYNVVAHIANGLEALDALGPHGGLRPSAVWIAAEGTVTLMDFALAQAILSGPGRNQIGEADYAYLAPELRAGNAASVQSDVFGLGALLYVLLTGRSPAQDFVRPSEVHEEADGALDEELLKALNSDPTQRHAHAKAFCEALLPLMSGLEEANADDFGVNVDIEINLASIAPSMPPPASASAVAHANAQLKAARAPTLSEVADPQAGMRVSIHENFRESQPDATEAAAAEQRQSLGAIDLQDVLTKITENDDARWMLVKDGMDHGPFTGKQLVNLIIKGEALADHGLLNMDTGERRKVKDFKEFTEFLAQYKLRKKEEEHKAALAHAETAERRSTLFKVGVGAAIVAVLALAGGTYLLTRDEAETAELDENVGDLYKRGKIDISGSAGILPTPKRRRGRYRGRGGGAGGGLSYEQAMMKAVDMGNLEQGGGEKQLSRGTIQGVMNRRLGGIYGACVKGSVGKVTIDMAILGSGAVQGVSVRGGDAALQSCVAKQVRRVRFPSFSAPRMGARFSFDT